MDYSTNCTINVTAHVIYYYTYRKIQDCKETSGYANWWKCIITKSLMPNPVHCIGFAWAVTPYLDKCFVERSAYFFSAEQPLIHEITAKDLTERFRKSFYQTIDKCYVSIFNGRYTNHLWLISYICRRHLLLDMIFIPGACEPQAWTHLVSWNCFGALVCVCPPPRTLISSGVIWCDIDHVIGQASFMAFSYFQLLYIILAVDKIDGLGFIYTAHREHLPKKTKWCGTNYRRTTQKTDHFSYKGEWANA